MWTIMQFWTFLFGWIWIPDCFLIELIFSTVVVSMFLPKCQKCKLKVQLGSKKPDTWEPETSENWTFNVCYSDDVFCNFSHGTNPTITGDRFVALLCILVQFLSTFLKTWPLCIWILNGHSKTQYLLTGLISTIQIPD